MKLFKLLDLNGYETIYNKRDKFKQLQYHLFINFHHET
jgi:hypothetical protein